MIGRNLRYLVALAACALLPLAGCSGGGSTTKVTEKGTEVTVSGKVDVSKATAKSTFLSATSAGAANNVFVYNALDGAQLGSGAIETDGSFKNLTFNLPATKTVLVFKAIVAQGTFRNVVPVDLSNTPAAGAITAGNPISIEISQDTTNRTVLVSQLLGLTGTLGDANHTLASVTKTYTDAAAAVVNNGGLQLAYSSGNLALSGKFSSAALLPALDAGSLSVDQLNNTTLDGAVTSVAIPGAKPIVSFYVTNKATGKGVRGLKAFNLVLAQLKTGTSGSPDAWLSYMVTATTRPTTDSGYTVIDNGDGSYTVIFGKDIKTTTGTTVTYNADLTHRIMVGVRTTPSVALQTTGSNLSNFYNEKYLVKDFIPATPTVAVVGRDMLTTEACNECHGKIGVTTPHGGRGDVRYCMMCHTSQRAIGRTASTSTAGAFPAITATSASTYVADGEVSGDFVTMIHKIHMGSHLTKTNYNYAGVHFNEIHYPKDVRNCRQCHKGDTTAELALAPAANNWKTKPSRKACGSCHDNVDFAAGTGHSAQTSDANCAGCHADASLLHMTEIATPNNPETPTGLTNFYYEIASAVVDPISNNLTIKFRIQKNTGSLTAAKTNVAFDGTATNPLVGYTGGPSFLLAYYKDTANQPAASFAADYNNLGVKAAQPKTVSIGSLLGGTNGTLGTADADGYYSAVVNSAAAFPAGSTLRAVGLQGYFTQAAGTNNIAASNARHALSAVKPVTGDPVRRDVVDSAKCATCHEWFEGHGGNRVVGKDTVGMSICTMCHVPNLSSSGKGANASNIGTTMTAAEQALLTADGYTLADPTTYPEESNNFKDMIHGIHAGNARTNTLTFVRDRGSVVMYFKADWAFPGQTKNCAQCHKGTTYTTIPTGAQVTTDLTSDGTVLTTSNNVTAVTAARTSLPNAVDKVTTPFTAACVSCHDSASAKAHMTQMGGQIKVNRSAAVPANESCVTCHGSTGSNSIFSVHRF